MFIYPFFPHLSPPCFPCSLHLPSLSPSLPLSLPNILLPPSFSSPSLSPTPLFLSTTYPACITHQLNSAITEANRQAHLKSSLPLPLYILIESPLALLNLQSMCKWSQENQHNLKTSLQVNAKLYRNEATKCVATCFFILQKVLVSVFELPNCLSHCYTEVRKYIAMFFNSH